MTKRLALALALLLAAPAGAQTIGDLVAVGPSQLQTSDAASACAAQGYCNAPLGLNFTGSITYGSGAGSPSGPANALIWAGGNGAYVPATGVCALTTGQLCAYVSFAFLDQVDASANFNGLAAFVIQDVVQAPAKGGRGVFNTYFTYQGSADTNQQYGTGSSYVKAIANNGGTSLAAAGALFGGNPFVDFQPGATFWAQGIGIETDMRIMNGAQVREMIFHQYVHEFNYTQPPQFAVGLSVNAQTAWKGTGFISGTTFDAVTSTFGQLLVGHTLQGTGIAPGTVITAYQGGSGGTGTYTVNINQNVGNINSTVATWGNPVGLDAMLQDGSFAGVSEISATGGVFRCFNTLNSNPSGGAGGCGTIGYGLDFGNYIAVTGNLLNGPQGNGRIDGNFNVVAATLTLNSSASFTATKTNCGNLASSTGCLILKDNNGNSVYAPLYGTL